MKTLVIYHGGGCFDGFCAAWLLSKAFPDAEFVGAHHGEPPPDVRGKHLIVADFSYKRPVMLDLAGQAESLTLLDHHQTAQADLAGLAEEIRDRFGPPRATVVFDMTKSGARLVWEFLYHRNRNEARSPFSKWVLGRDYFLDVPPWPVAYTEDRDLWRWAISHSREVNASLRSYPLDFTVWDSLADRPVGDFVPEGAAILRAERQVVDTHVRNAAEIELAGHKVLAVNATTLISEIAGELAKGRPFGASWFDRADGTRVWSLRSRDGGVDVSEIARQRGGGGHARAAGFQVKLSA